MIDSVFLNALYSLYTTDMFLGNLAKMIATFQTSEISKYELCNVVIWALSHVKIFVTFSHLGIVS